MQQHFGQKIHAFLYHRACCRVKTVEMQGSCNVQMPESYLQNLRRFFCANGNQISHESVVHEQLLSVEQIRH